MAIQFGRKVEVTISELNKPGIFIDNLYTVFSVQKDTSSDENKADVQIFNLNEYNRGWIDRIETRKDAPLYLLLKAGYQDNPKQLFFGDIQQAQSKLEGPDWVTEIVSKDGNTKNLTAKISRPFTEGSTLSQVIEYLVSQLGFTRKTIKGVPDITYKAGMALSGYARTELDSICRSYDLQWFVEDGTITIMPQITDTGETVVLVSPESGLVGSPVKTENGIECLCLINGDFKSGRRVQMESASFPKANYKIIQVEHKGNSDDGDFYSKLTLKKL